MSGPKCYSVHVFDKHLKQIFQLRAEIILLIEEISCKKLIDELRGVKYVGEDFITEHKISFAQLLEKFEVPGNDKLNQGQFNEYYDQYFRKQQELLLFKDELREELAHADQIENSYHIFLNLELLVKDYLLNFDGIKSQFLNQIRQTIQEVNKLEEFGEKFSKINLFLVVPPFSEDLPEIEAELKLQFAKTFEQAKKQLSDLILHHLSGDALQVAKKKVFLVNHNQNSESRRASKITDIENILSKINEALSGISDPDLSALYRTRLVNLRQKHPTSESYFYIEFLTEIREAEKQYNFKKILNQALNDLNKHVFEPPIEKSVSQFSFKIQQLLKRDKLKNQDCEKVITELKGLFESNRKVYQKRVIHEEEQAYIKSMMIAGLRDLNYEVMTDMQVIDFGQEDTFLMSIPGQENFLNIRFDSEGGMLYNFLILENRDELTHEQKELKLAEMDETCVEFKSMLQQLKLQGLNIDLDKETQATEKALVQLPSKYLTATKKMSSKKNKKGSATNQKFLE